MHYLDEGPTNDTPILLCLHGNPSWSFMYRHVVSAFKPSVRVIAPDHIGCGLSDKPDDNNYDYTLQNRIADIEALLKHLEIDRPITLLLHDWGGMIGLSVLRRNSRLLKNIVLMNTSGFSLPKDKPLPWQLCLARSPLGTLLIRGLNAFAKGTASIGTRKPMDPLVRKGYLAPYDSWHNRIATLRFVQDIPLSAKDRAWDIVQQTADSLQPLLSNAPVRIYWGKHDPVFDDYFLRDWRKRLPNAVIKEYDDAGHYVLEEKYEDIIAGLSEFLQN